MRLTICLILIMIGSSGGTPAQAQNNLNELLNEVSDSFPTGASAPTQSGYAPQRYPQGQQFGNLQQNQYQRQMQMPAPNRMMNGGFGGAGGGMYPQGGGMYPQGNAMYQPGAGNYQGGANSQFSPQTYRGAGA